jgi:ABC-type amino acid transport substrate-binding protein
MPFRSYAGFNAEMLRNMTAAYDSAVAKLQIKSDDPLTSKLAAAIAALAADGERDPVKLCERSIAELQK